MKHCFVLNPAAGHSDRTTEMTARLSALCRERGLDFAVSVSHAPGECMTLAKKFAAAGEECRIYACGGDGTLNEVINGVAGYENAAVTHFPMGSGNDFIRSSSDPAAFSDLGRLLDAEETRFDLIDINGRRSINISSVGIDARIGMDVTAFKRLPLVNGSSAYLISTAVNVVKGIHRHYVIEIGGEVIDGQQTLLCACNACWYGGGFHPMPEALLDDGLVDVLLITAVSRLQVAQIIGKYKAGRYAEYPDLIRHFRVSEFTVHCDEPERLQIDGEELTAQDITFRVLPRAVRFFYPKGLSWAVCK